MGGRYVVLKHRLHCGEGLVQLLGASCEQLGLLADLVLSLSVFLGDLERFDDLEDLLDLDLPFDGYLPPVPDQWRLALLDGDLKTEEGILIRVSTKTKNVKLEFDNLSRVVLGHN